MSYAYKIRNDYFQSVANGEINGQKPFSIFGNNADIDSAAAEDVWYHGEAPFTSYPATFVPPVVARTHNVVSSSALDSSASTGARRVFIQGLDSSYNEISEVLVLNGTTVVTTANQYIFINKMTVVDAGTVNGANVGDIGAIAQTELTLSALIQNTKGVSQAAIYMVPNGYRAFLHHSFVSMFNTNANATADVFLMVRLPSATTFAPMLTPNEITLSTSGTSIIEINPKPPYVFEAKSIIKARASVNTNNTRVQVAMNGILQAI